MRHSPPLTRGEYFYLSRGACLCLILFFFVQKYSFWSVSCRNIHIMVYCAKNIGQVSLHVTRPSQFTVWIWPMSLECFLKPWKNVGAQLSVFQGRQLGFSHKNQDRIKNVELYTHFRNCALPPSGPDRAQRQQSNLITPPNVWHKNQDRIKNVDF